MLMINHPSVWIARRQYKRGRRKPKCPVGMLRWRISQHGLRYARMCVLVLSILFSVGRFSKPHSAMIAIFGLPSPHSRTWCRKAVPLPWPCVHNRFWHQTGILEVVKPHSAMSAIYVRTVQSTRTQFDHYSPPLSPVSNQTLYMF